MRLILDSNEYIFGFNPVSEKNWSNVLLDELILLRDEIKGFELFVPDIIRDEVQRNLPPIFLDDFYRFITSHPKIILASIFDVPENYFQRYHLDLGLKEADATIAAFADWKDVDVLVSENRHFLGLKVEKFKVYRAKRFVHLLESDEIWQMIGQNRHE